MILLLFISTIAIAQDQLLGPNLWYDPSIGLLTTNKFSGTATIQDIDNLNVKLNSIQKLQKQTLKNAKCSNILTGKTKPLC